MPLDLLLEALRLLAPMPVCLDAGSGLDHRVQKTRDIALLIVQGRVTECAPEGLAARVTADAQGRVLDKARLPFQGLENPRPHCRPDFAPQCIERLAEPIHSAAAQCMVGIIVHHRQVWPPDHGTGERRQVHHIHRDAQRSRPARQRP